MEKQKRSGASAEQSTGAAIEQLDCIHHSSDLTKIAATVNEGDEKSLLPDTKGAIKFLNEWPCERWVLTSIHPERRKATTATFGPETRDAAAKWIEVRQGVENIYFMVNPAIRDLNKKAKKTDVNGMVCLHVDVDPRAGEDLINEQERALRVLREYIPPPSAIIFSGGGYQGFWLLNEEQQISGDKYRIEELEAYNRKIELDLQGDHCHNVDRIMRLPGTINVPDEKKCKKGRVPALACVVEAKWTRRYSLDQFTRAPGKQTQNSDKAQVTLSSDLPRLGSVEDLPASVTDRIKSVIVHGGDPEDPKAYASRSEAVFGVACELVRAGVEDDTIASILLDPDYGISAHCLAQPRSQEYAARQIQRAKEKGKEKPTREFTDLGNAQRLIDLHGIDLLYAYQRKSWFWWDERRWLRDNGSRIDDLVKDVPMEIRQEASGISGEAMEQIRQQIFSWSKSSQTKERLRATHIVAQSLVAISPEEFDANDWVLNVANGTVDLRTGKLSPHSRDDRITKLAEVEYDANAKCPRFEAFLKRIMGWPTEREISELPRSELKAKKRRAARLVKFLQRAIGYSLTGSTVEQVLFICHGSGANGKSTLLEIIRAALGDYSRTTDTQTFSAQYSYNSSGPTENIARLHGARFVTAVESGEDQRMDEKLIKQLTGSDKITARFLHQNSFEFYPAFKVWIGANHLPEIRGQDHAIWRRQKAIPFLVTIPKSEQDPKLKERIVSEELRGVLAWMVRGCLMWQRRGLASPHEVDAYTQQYREDMDILGEFISAICKLGPAESATVGDIWNSYEQWCMENGEQPLKQRTFSRRLKDRGIRSDVMWDPDEKKSKRYYQGLGFKLMADEEPAQKELGGPEHW